MAKKGKKLNKDDYMTFGEVLESLQEELADNPDWKNKPATFETSDSTGLHFLSIYTCRKKDGFVCIDIGTGDE